MGYLEPVEQAVQRLMRRLAEGEINPRLYIQRGMASFQLGHVEAAIDDFDRAEPLNPALTPYFWQRGIAYYYAERFADGARQFEVDLSVNGSNVEETVWRYLCQAQLDGAVTARQALARVGGDSRPVMGWVYGLFSGTCSAEQVLDQYRDAGRRDLFYSRLYVGLYLEAERDRERSRDFITQPAEMQVLEDYMGWVAVVHRHLRGWGRG
jgi:lipoprotein NlpI